MNTADSMVGSAGRLSTPRTIRCSGTVIVHADQSLTCSDPACTQSEDRSAWIGCHALFVGCAALDGTALCPRCTPAITA